TRRALKRAKMTLADIDRVELNDSFAAQWLAVEQELGLDRDIVNVNGGALALGHPMAATGTRLVLSALYELARSDRSTALCTLCVGGGQGVAVVLKR
ncbi:MAG: acetyl-CoA C-acyltransferase, partial [Myxococcota bacterium]